MKLIVGILIGLFIAWNVPQPQFAKQFQEWSRYKIHRLTMDSYDHNEENYQNSLVRKPCVKRGTPDAKEWNICQ